MTFIVATYVSASSQGQRTHYAPTNLHIFAPLFLHEHELHPAESHGNSNPFFWMFKYFQWSSNCAKSNLAGRVAFSEQSEPHRKEGSLNSYSSIFNPFLTVFPFTNLSNHGPSVGYYSP